MSYREWAIQNPILMPEYKGLLGALKHTEVEIKAELQKIEDAKQGIAPIKNKNPFMPEMYTLGISFKQSFMSALIFGDDNISTPAHEEAMETLLIERKKREHEVALEATIKTADRNLNGWTADFLGNSDSEPIVFEGLYEKKDKLVAQIEAFNPVDHIIEWRDDPEELIEYAINQRLNALQMDCVKSLEQTLLAVWIVALGKISLRTYLSYTLKWIASIDAGDIHFTRVDTDPFYALQRALIAYLDARWDDLVREFLDEAPS